ncbi:hypothetical protein [Thermoactinospora rubra]|uniref:hypothetical protein n=1 Tax=Thermoactinospora rubra TaxID=1088767 RepID=UPI000A1123B1|nr:hypothetical protein [Thermoactinospora rubra]
MTATNEKIEDLERRVCVLETWAGPGQAEALAQTIRDTRGEVKEIKTRVRRIEKTQQEHSVILREHSVLLREILDRLPPKK